MSGAENVIRYRPSSLYIGVYMRPFGILIWPRIVTCWRIVTAARLRGLLKGSSVSQLDVV